MDDDLNVGNLLETHAERTPATQRAEPLPRTRAPKHKAPFPVTAWTIAAVIAVLAMVMISGTSGRRVHVMERY
ncbi:MAG: hypothetical protein ACREQV_03280 [Candidatus Binatia bacterium]